MVVGAVVVFVMLAASGQWRLWLLRRRFACRVSGINGFGFGFAVWLGVRYGKRVRLRGS